MRIRINVDVSNLTEELPMLAQYIRRDSAFAMYRALTILKAQVMQNIRQNSGLHVRTGNLLNSINTNVQVEGDRIVGRVFSENVPYAMIHEYGGVIPTQIVYPRKAQTLSWGKGGSKFFSKKVVIPEHTIPARPYMFPAIEERSQEIYETFGLIISKNLGD